MNALIIDDNSKNVTVLSRLLGSAGLSVQTITQTKDLDTQLTNIGGARVVFLDLELPGVNGYEILARLKANPDFAAAPVIAYTVHVSEIHAARDQGFDGFIGKPLDSDRFPDQLARILNGEPVWETA